MPPTKRRTVAKTRSRRSEPGSRSVRTVADPGKLNSTTVITKTQTYVQRSSGSASTETSNQRGCLLDEPEPWQRRPKTDYTYARSPTYSPRFIGHDWVMPNMSRPRLRGGAPVEISPMSAVTQQSLHSESVRQRAGENAESVRQRAGEHRSSVRSSRRSAPWSVLLADRHSQSQRLSTTRTDTSSPSSDHTSQDSYASREVQATPMRRKTGHTSQSIEDDIEVDLHRLSESVTRSGRRHKAAAGGRTTRQSQLSWDSQQDEIIAENDLTDLTIEEYMKVEKQLEYSGRAGPHKESSKVSLYGLDQDELDDDLSETEVYLQTSAIEHRPRASRTQRVAQRTSTTSILTVIMTIVYTSWSVVMAPLAWVTSLIQSDDSITSTTNTSQTNVAYSRDKSASKTNTTTARVSRSTTISSFSDDDQIAGEFVTEEQSISNRDKVLLDKDDISDESYCSKIGFYVIFSVYLVCVELPIGVVHLLRRFFSWVHSSVLLTVGVAQWLRQSVASLYTSVIHTERGGISLSSYHTIDVHTEQHDDGETTAHNEQRTTQTFSAKSSLRRASTVILSGDDEDTEDTSLCGRCCYYFIALVYLLCVAVPIGIAKAMRESVVWIYTLLSAVVDAASWTLRSGRSFLPARLTTASTVNNSTDVTLAATDSLSTVSVLLRGIATLPTVFTSVIHHGIQGFGYYSNSMTSSVWVILHHLHSLLRIPWVVTTTAGAVCWNVGAWFHRVVANVLLIDVWVLSRVGERRSGACCCLLPLLLLLLLVPFMLLPGSGYFLAGSVEEDKSAASVVSGSDGNTVPASQPQTQTLSTLALREIIEEELILAKADLKSHDSALYQESLEHILQLEGQLVDLRGHFTKLEAAQLALVAQLKDCCQNKTTLAALVRNGVQDQLATIALGGGSDDATEGDTEASGADSEGRPTQYSNSAFVTWLNSQFAKPGDFDGKIAALTAELNRGLREQAESSRAAAVAAAQAEQAAHDALKEAHSAAGLAVSVQTAQGEQAAAWGRDKADISGAMAGALSELRDRDDQLASDITAAAAMLAATGSGGGGAGAGGQADEGSGGAGGGLGVGAGCGCDGHNFILPDTYQAITEEQVKLLIREALGIFGADKTGMVDYALESAGGSVISTRCSETYHRRTAQISLFGIPLWYTSNSPRTVIQPEVHAGQCWAFRGSQGFIVVQLAGYVQATAFSLEHIPKVLSPSGQIDSAPKDFSVWGLRHERDIDGKLLGNYTYLDNDEPLQFFHVTDTTADAYHIMELRILSNHGNQEYTCLYRFRVHGLLRRT